LTGYFRVFHVGAIAALLMGAGCQDNSSLPPEQSAPTDPQSITARLLMVDRCQDPAAKQTLVRDMIKAINAERIRSKIAPLHVSDTLTQLSEFYACRLAEGDFFSHVDPYNGSTVDSRATDFGYPFLKIGENLAAGQRTVEQTMTELMNSPGHRANILDPTFTEIGVSVKDGGSFGQYWVQEFGRPVTAGEYSGAAASAPADASSKPTSRQASADGNP